jgi:hypothetical protein
MRRPFKPPMMSDPALCNPRDLTALGSAAWPRWLTRILCATLATFHVSSNRGLGRQQAFERFRESRDAGVALAAGAANLLRILEGHRSEARGRGRQPAWCRPIAASPRTRRRAPADSRADCDPRGPGRRGARGFPSPKAVDAADLSETRRSAGRSVADPVERRLKTLNTEFLVRIPCGASEPEARPNGLRFCCVANDGLRASHARPSRPSTSAATVS